MTRCAFLSGRPRRVMPAWTRTSTLPGSSGGYGGPKTKTVTKTASLWNAILMSHDGVPITNWHLVATYVLPLVNAVYGSGACAVLWTLCC